MKKIRAIYNGDVVLKYQLIPEEMDILVSVTSDEDLQHMLDEHDRRDTKSTESSGLPRLRAFLFSPNPVVVESQAATTNNTMDNQGLEQRYIDAINGVVRSTPINTKRTSGSISHPSTSYSISSSGSSPKSVAPESVSTDHNVSIEHSSDQHLGQRRFMQRVHSSPNLSSLANANTSYPNPSQQHQKQFHPCYPPSTSRLPTPFKGGGGGGHRRLSGGPNELGRRQLGPCQSCYYNPTRWRGGCADCGYIGDSGFHQSGGFEMAGGFPPYPIRSKPWD
nr:TPA_asm: hypothetical protein HUJ06_005872 [Nelumbo nucifera]